VRWNKLMIFSLYTVTERVTITLITNRNHASYCLALTLTLMTSIDFEQSFPDCYPTVLHNVAEWAVFQHYLRSPLFTCLLQIFKFTLLSLCYHRNYVFYFQHISLALKFIASWRTTLCQFLFLQFICHANTCNF